MIGSGWSWCRSIRLDELMTKTSVSNRFDEFFLDKNLVEIRQKSIFLLLCFFKYFMDYPQGSEHRKLIFKVIRWIFIEKKFSKNLKIFFFSKNLFFFLIFVLRRMWEVFRRFFLRFDDCKTKKKKRRKLIIQIYKITSLKYILFTDGASRQFDGRRPLMPSEAKIKL